MIVGCGGDGSDDTSCESMYSSDAPEYTLCKFVEYLNQANEGGGDVGRELMNHLDVWVGVTLYENNFDYNCTSYELLQSKFRAEAAFSLYNPQGAKFEDMKIIQDDDAARCQLPGKNIRKMKVDVNLDNGKGFPVHTLVNIEGSWRILTLQYLM